MRSSFTTLVALTLFSLISCQSSTSPSDQLVKPVAAPEPLPAWTEFANNKQLQKSTNMVKILTKLVEIRTPASAPSAPKLSNNQYREFLSPSETQKYLRTLSQRKGTDIITSPSVVTLEGQLSKTEIGRELIYPDKDKPGESRKVLLGSTQHCLISPHSTKGRVNIDVIIEIKELIGYSGLEGKKDQPVIQTRRLKGTSTVKNGHSLILSGLVTEEEQHTENRILFFRKKSVTKFHTELIAIITVQEIDVTGEPR